MGQVRTWRYVSKIDTIPRNEGRRVQFLSGEVLAVFNLGDEYVAVDNVCPHKGGPLADGIIAGKSVFCPLHNWKINLENGCAQAGGTGCVKKFPVKVFNEKIYVALEEGQYHKQEEVVQEEQSSTDIN